MERVPGNDVWVSLLSVRKVVFMRRLMVAVCEYGESAVFRDAGLGAWSAGIWSG